MCNLLKILLKESGCQIQDKTIDQKEIRVACATMPSKGEDKGRIRINCWSKEKSMMDRKGKKGGSPDEPVSRR